MEEPIIDYKSIKDNQNALLLHKDSTICEDLKNVAEEIIHKKAYKAKIIDNIPMDYTTTVNGYVYRYMQFDTDVSNKPLVNPDNAKYILLIHSKVTNAIEYDLKGNPYYNGYAIVGSRYAFGRDIIIASKHISTIREIYTLACNCPAFCRDLFHVMYNSNDMDTYKNTLRYICVISKVTHDFDDITVSYPVIQSGEPIMNRTREIYTHDKSYTASVTMCIDPENEDRLKYTLDLNKKRDRSELSICINNQKEYRSLVNCLRMMCYDYLDQNKL